MKTQTGIYFFLGLFICSLAQAQDITAFTNVMVLPMDRDQVLAAHTVVVEGDRIRSIGAEVEVPSGANVIDGTGKFLMPGLAEMHGHIPRPDEPEQYTEDVLFLYVANGITTVRGMLGAEGQLELRQRANNSELIAPNLYLAGPSFNGSSVNSPEQAVAMARSQVAEGWDLLKVHPGLTKDEFDAMARTAAEEGIRFGGHVPADVGLIHALNMDQETFDHVDGYVEYLRSQNRPEDEMLEEAIALTKEKGAWIVPTMAFWEVLYGTIDLEDLRAYDELKYMPRTVVDYWFRAVEERQRNPGYDRAAALELIRTRMRVLRALNESEVRILMGTDSPQLFSVPGFSLHRELKRMVDAGMSNYAILDSGTRAVGEYLAHKDTFGTISEGSRADLILVDGNPLDDLAKLKELSGVMVRGNWLSRADIQVRLESIEESHSVPNRR
ncbi:MAG: amidohydrolase family protein [Rhodothermaceae bacterium]|nr:amidohydrolase family protein [Rhodothermaceae bacterium]MXZ59135.1 amidohydrolase family protein [Rhodothermaceae bacterium]MYB90286.1 amidohydrolase family protein [Rhodothermaceae bacterium]MYD68538.1 amidohydrolase family protein [Rhodothermaceae bacterium]MYG45669.1 amidohydrolase family protein [Rhodothermaceae bacterium]